MSKYLLFCDTGIKKITYFDYPKRYNIKEKVIEGFKLSNIHIPLLSKFKIDKEIDDQMVNLIRYITQLLENEDPDEGDYVYALDEINRLQGIIMALHIKNKDNSLYTKYLKILNHYENKLSNKYHSGKKTKKGGKK